jgi:hypothetical protein
MDFNKYEDLLNEMLERIEKTKKMIEKVQILNTN